MSKAAAKAKTKKAAAKTVKAKKPKYPEKFTATTIAKYLAEVHELPQKKAKEIMEDLFDVMHAGAMGGERVPVGNFGKIFVKVKPARKARVGRNPMTGEEIKIPAKKATKVPKFTFSKNMKEAVLKAKIKTK